MPIKFVCFWATCQNMSDFMKGFWLMTIWVIHLMLILLQLTTVMAKRSKQFTVVSNGAFELNVPHNRDSSFAPVLVKKGQKTLDEIEGRVIPFCGLGMSTADI